MDTADAAMMAPVPAGAPLRPWLHLGPWYEDVSDEVAGLTLHERAGAAAGTALLDAATHAALALLRQPVAEGRPASWRGQTACWHLVRRPEPLLSWGQYFIANHLVCVILATGLQLECATVTRWRLTRRTTGRALLLVDGQLQHQQDADASADEFAIPLAAGRHQLAVVLLRIGRMARVDCRLERCDAPAHLCLPGAASLTAARRGAVEREIAGMRLRRDLFCHGEQIGVWFDEPRGDVPLRLSLVGLATPREQGHHPAALHAANTAWFGATPCAVPAGQQGEFVICPAQALQPGSYTILAEWLDDHGTIVTSTDYAIHVAAPRAGITGPSADHDQRRRAAALAYFADAHDWHPSPPVWRELARYALGRDDVDESRLHALCDYIDRRQDCSDFAIQGLLRLLVWEQRRPRLSQAIRIRLRATVLGFKYWVDEPGDTVMYMGSENHRLLFHVAEWLAGQLFPLDEFTNSRQRGLFHALKGRMFITEWIRQRARYGCDEWHSNAYYPIIIAPLLNVWDFAPAEDEKLRQLAGGLLDILLFNLAADSVHGVFGTAHGRSYGLYCKYAELDDAAGIGWTLWGRGVLADGVFGMAPVSLATSGYRPPALLYEIAHDAAAVIESRQRAGVLPGTAPDAHLLVYRTPEYMLSAVLDHRAGEPDSSLHVAQLTLPGRAAIIWSCPATSAEGGGLRPDYWSGNAVLPRAIQLRSVLLLHWQLRADAWMSHALFETDRFDEVVWCAGGWVCARVARAYVALWAAGGLRLGRHGQFAGRELICDARDTVWVVECGREADWGTFAAFVAAQTAAVPHYAGGQLVYRSPACGEIRSAATGPVTCDGAPVRLRHEALLDSPWGQARFGAGEYRLHYGATTLERWMLL